MITIERFNCFPIAFLRWMDGLDMFPRSRLSLACIVGHNPCPGSLVDGPNGYSRNNNRPDLIADTFQIKTRLFECHVGEVSNILTQDEARSALVNDSEHFRPEVTVILRASSLPGCTKWLTREAARNEVAPSPFVNDFFCERPNVAMNGYSRKVLAQYALRIILDFAKPNSLNSEPSTCKGETTDPGKQVNMSHGS